MLRLEGFRDFLLRRPAGRRRSERARGVQADELRRERAQLEDGFDQGLQVGEEPPPVRVDEQLRRENHIRDERHERFLQCVESRHSRAPQLIRSLVLQDECSVHFAAAGVDYGYKGGQFGDVLVLLCGVRVAGGRGGHYCCHCHVPGDDGVRVGTCVSTRVVIRNFRHRQHLVITLLHFLLPHLRRHFNLLNNHLPNPRDLVIH